MSISFVPLGNAGQCHLVPEGTPNDEFEVSNIGKDFLTWDVRADSEGSFRFLDGEWLHRVQGMVHISVGTASPTGEAEYRDGSIHRGVLDFFDEIVAEDTPRLETEFQLVLHVTPRLYSRLAELAFQGSFPTVRVEAVELDIECVQGKHTEEWAHRMQKFVRIAWFEFHYALGSADERLTEDTDDKEN